MYVREHLVVRFPRKIVLTYYYIGTVVVRKCISTCTMFARFYALARYMIRRFSYHALEGGTTASISPTHMIIERSKFGKVYILEGKMLFLFLYIIRSVRLQRLYKSRRRRLRATRVA